MNINNKSKNDLSVIKLTNNESIKQLNSKRGFPKINIIKSQNYINEEDKNLSKKPTNKNLSLNYVPNKNDNKSISNNRIEDYFSIKNNFNFNYIGNKVFTSTTSKDFDKKSSSIFEPEFTKTNYIKTSLFPYRYYLCSIFIKQIDISKKSLFFSKKFKIVYNFLSQLLDISSYLILEKEFEIMKNIVLVDKFKDIMENNKKINVNDICFNDNMKECLTTQKLSILGQINTRQND